ncbi:hypothetical protein OIU34_22850 [Pararhizobium sp. BT-229]|uniref:hypothetical protein n=1 Tax=Pararhizobium sp. BT-229 TaxID=2986923 RepID=UPI0021F6FF0A|nr:hypothetical protein [Pararhizobium sp. BT-229]MCV9964734.1 hypothetical protein [Pararhizobium sp. BT-229]
MPAKQHDDGKFPNFASYLLAAADDPGVRKKLVSRIASEFRRSLASILTESQLIGIDYANTYGVLFTGKTSCASHDYHDTTPVFWNAMTNALSERTGGQGNRAHPMHESGRDLYDIIATQDNELGRAGAAVWNEAWNAAAAQGYSALWAVKERVLAEATFQTLAEIVMTPPDRVGPNDQRFPGFPMVTDEEDEIRAAGRSFLEHVTPISADVAVEAATLVHHYADEDDAAAIIEFFHSFAPATAQRPPQP